MDDFGILKQLMTYRNSAWITYDLMMHAAQYCVFTVCHASIFHSYHTDIVKLYIPWPLASLAKWQAYRTLVHDYLENTGT